MQQRVIEAFIIKALKDNDIDKLRELLIQTKEHHNIISHVYKDKDKLQILIDLIPNSVATYAAKNSDKEMLKQLMDKNIDFNDVANHAAINGHRDIILSLLDKDIFLDDVVIQAARYGHLKLVKELLKLSDEKDNKFLNELKDERIKQHFTDIYKQKYNDIAIAAVKHKDILTYMIKQGADDFFAITEEAIKQGVSDVAKEYVHKTKAYAIMFEFAAEYGHIGLVDYMAKEMVKYLNEIYDEDAENLLKSSYKRAIYHALSNADKKMIEKLKDLTGYNYIDIVDRIIVEREINKNKHKELMNDLVKEGDIDKILVNMDDSILDTTLLALKHNQHHVLEILLQILNEKELYEVLTYVALEGNLNAIKFILDKVDNKKAPSIIASHAAINGHIHIIQEMLNKNIKNYSEIAVNAASNGHLNIIKLMLSKGAKNYTQIAEKAKKNNYNDVYEYIVNIQR